VPYDQPEARERSLRAAREQASAYVDGEVSWSAERFVVTLSLHRADGRQLGEASGQGRGLYEAVRAAMAPLVAQGILPRADLLEPEISEWARTSDVDAALAVTDLNFAFAHNAGGLNEECAAFERMSPKVRELGVEGRLLCAYVLGQPLPALQLNERDRAPGAVTAQIRLRHAFSQQMEPTSPQYLRGLLESETSPRAQSVIAGTLSCLLGASDPQGAREMAIRAVRSDPKNLEGGLCTPWEQLAAQVRTRPLAEDTVPAMQTWQPWNSYAWLEPAFHPGIVTRADLPLLWRAHKLSPLDAQIADKLSSGLLAIGEEAGAQGVAATLSKGTLPLHRLEIELITTRIEASNAGFGAALEHALRARDRKSTRLNSSHNPASRMPSSA
jgi:hypothetical protein